MDVNEKMKKLLKALANDESLLDKFLDENDKSPSYTEKRKNENMSPLRLKKVKFSTSSKPGSSQKIITVDKIPTPSTSSSSSHQAISQDVDTSCDSQDREGLSDEDEQSNESNLLDEVLANAYDDDDFEEENDEEDIDSDEFPEDEFEIFSGPKTENWVPSDKVTAFFNKVADIKLEKVDYDKLKTEFSHSEDVAHHFTVPKLPTALWNTVKSSSVTDPIRLKSIGQAQDYLYTALKPLLSCLEESDKGSSMRNNLTKSIQMICSSNLVLNKYRRAVVAPFLKKDIKKQLMDLPVKHDSIFGSDFDKTTESIVKEQAALNKVIANKSAFERINYRRGTTRGFNYAKPKVQQAPKTFSNSSFRGRRGQNRGSFNRGRGRGNKSRTASTQPNSSTD